MQAVIIETDSPYLSKGWSVLRRPPHLPIHFRVRLGERYEVAEDINGFVDDLRAYFVRELVDAELGDLWKVPRREPAPVVKPRIVTAPRTLRPAREALRARGRGG